MDWGQLLPSSLCQRLAGCSSAAKLQAHYYFQREYETKPNYSSVVARQIHFGSSRPLVFTIGLLLPTTFPED